MASSTVQLATLLTAKETAEVLHVSIYRVNQMSRDGMLSAAEVRLGRPRRFDPEGIKTFIAGGGVRLPGDWRKRPQAATPKA
ncbi:MAG: hypothetical protein ABSC08_07890 [Bryobacteraceae bacterium]|jgi:hypothetical protein